MSRIYARANLRCCSLRTGTVVAVQNRTWALLFGGVRLPRKRLRARIQCRHTRIASVCLLLVFQKEGENRSLSSKERRDIFRRFAFSFFFGSSNFLEKVFASYIEDLSLFLDKSKNLSFFFVLFFFGGVLVLLLFFCSFYFLVQRRLSCPVVGRRRRRRRRRRQSHPT